MGMLEIGDRIRQLRCCYKISQKALASNLNLPEEVVSKIEQG